MKLAPDARQDDGVFDVVLIGDVTKLDFLTTAPKLYSGRYLSHPKVELLQSSSVAIDATEPLPLEVDGEPIGDDAWRASRSSHRRCGCGFPLRSLAVAARRGLRRAGRPRRLGRDDRPRPVGGRARDAARRTAVGSADVARVDRAAPPRVVPSGRRRDRRDRDLARAGRHLARARPRRRPAPVDAGAGRGGGVLDGGVARRRRAASSCSGTRSRGRRSTGTACTSSGFDSSWPSGHALRCALVAGALAAAWPRLRVPLAIWLAGRRRAARARRVPHADRHRRRAAPRDGRRGRPRRAREVRVSSAAGRSSAGPRRHLTPACAQASASPASPPSSRASSAASRAPRSHACAAAARRHGRRAP